MFVASVDVGSLFFFLGGEGGGTLEEFCSQPPSFVIRILYSSSSTSTNDTSNWSE